MSNVSRAPGMAWARYWAVDLHVHTPASHDVNERQYGEATAEDVVKAAIKAGLDAIAITDHNTVAWCDEVGAAAATTELVVLPGVEVSTTEGHLLAIWEEGTPARRISEVLITLGIAVDDQGKLDTNAKFGFSDASNIIAEANGLSVAAHADKNKGLLGLSVAAHVKSTLLNESLAAVELVDANKRAEVQRKVGDERQLAFIQSSDTIEPGSSGHRLSAIGTRRTWIKASRPDLCGLKHAFNDPSLRVTLDEPDASQRHARIASVAINGGFLDGETFRFSPDLNCLVGGTGTGKSLTLECVRFALDQQVNADAFPQIHREVWDRLCGALGVDSTVTVVVFDEAGDEYVIERSFSETPSRPVIRRRLGDGDLVPVGHAARTIAEVSAFSQGEALEYSREKVGRMALVDAGLDLSHIEARIAELVEQLTANGASLLAQRNKIADLETSDGDNAALADRLLELEAIFESDVVKSHKAWHADTATVEAVLAAIPDHHDLVLELVLPTQSAEWEGNEEFIQETRKIIVEANDKISGALDLIAAAVVDANVAALGVRTEWDERFAKFEQDLAEALDSAPDSRSLVALERELTNVRTAETQRAAAEQRMKTIERPLLDDLQVARAELIKALMKVRQERRVLRRERIEELNKRTAGVVKMDLPAAGDRTAFRESLGRLKIGSRLNDAALAAVAASYHPAQFAEAMHSEKLQDLADRADDVDLETLTKLFVNFEARDLWDEVLALEVLDTPDVLNIRFKRPTGEFAPLEELAHGQKCTAIIVVLLADGRTSVIVDQPEDALHAPWIEDHLVGTLRELRGERQYIFATRSPGVVVSADAEQIITMTANAGRGRVEASGSLERYDLNELVLHHLEGGPTAFDRRHRKLYPSVS